MKQLPLHSMGGESPLFTVKEAAAYLKVTPAAIYKWCARKKLRHHRLGTSIRIRREDLDEFLAANAREVEEG